MKEPLFSISEVSGTMLITLYARARESLPDSRYQERWSEKYKFPDEWTYFDDREKKSGWFNLFSSVNILRKAQWTVRYRIIK
jgi:hypothetical protein